MMLKTALNLTKLVPEGSEIHQALVLYHSNTYLEALRNVLEVAAHDTEAHKNGYKCGYEVGTGVICDKSYNEKGKCWKHVPMFI